MAFEVLRSHAKKQASAQVKFDPFNSDHMAAYLMLMNKGKSRGQHPTLRFILEYPYLDVVSMMHAKIGAAYVKVQFKSDRTLQSMVNGSDLPELPVTDQINTNQHAFGIRKAFA